MSITAANAIIDAARQITKAAETQAATQSGESITSFPGFAKFQSLYPILSRELQARGQTFTKQSLELRALQRIRDSGGDRSVLQNIDSELDRWQTPATINKDLSDLLEGALQDVPESVKPLLVAERTRVATELAQKVTLAHDVARAALFEAMDITTPPAPKSDEKVEDENQNAATTAQQNAAGSALPSDEMPTWVWFAIGGAILLFIIVMVIVILASGRETRDDDTSQVYAQPMTSMAPVSYAQY